MRSKPASVSLFALVVALVWTGGCDTQDDIITSTGTLRVSVVDRDLDTQFGTFSDPSDPPGRQVVAWEIESAILEIPEVDPGAFEYVLLTPPCIHRQFAPAEVALLDCDLIPVPTPGVGYAMDPRVPLQLSMRLLVERMDIRRANRPLLLPDADFDGDLVLNETDNCVLIDNPDQSDFNGDGFGDACSLPDFNGDPTIPDRDGDREADITDNCVWIVNPDQADSTPAGGIGDACEELAPVVTPPIELTLGPIAVTVESNTWSFVSADFRDQTALSCDPAFTSCTLDPGAVELTSP